MKKLFSSALALVIGASMIPAALANEADSITIPGEEVLYYNTFPTGTNADLPEVEHELYYFYGRNANLKYALNAGMEYIHNSDTTVNTHTYSMALDDLQAVEFNGNIGARVRSNCSLGAGPVVMLDFRYSDSDKTPTAEGALKSGVYRFAFDFALDGTNTTTNGFRVEANCKHGNCGNSFAWMMNDAWHNLSGGNTWSYTEQNIPITNDELHHYELIFDLDSNKAITYMDGVRRKDTAYSGNINFLHLTIGGKMKYVDNILFTKMDAGYAAEQNVEVLSNDENGMTLKFSEYIADMSKFDGITYTDVFTGNTINTSVVGVASEANTIKIVPESMLALGHEYIFNADVEIKGLRGGSVGIKTQNVTPGVVESVTVNDYNGEEKAFTQETVAEIDSLTFAFESGKVAESILANLALYDNTGNPVELNVEPTDELNVAKAYIAKNLKGGKEYSLILNGLDEPYEWKFKTGEGGFSMKPVKFYKADGITPVSLADMSLGDTIKAKYEVVNTGENTGDLEFALTMGLYSKNGLIDFNYEDVKLTGGADYYSATVDFTVSKTDDLKAKGFIWESINTRKPLYNPVVTK